MRTVRWGGVGVAAAVLLAWVAVLAGLGWVVWQQCGLRGCPDVELVEDYLPDEASTVLDRHGGELARLYLVRRLLVPLDSVPAHVQAAIVAVEDRRFWEHGGVDWRRVPGAAWRNLRAWDVEEGFSTITMQLARNVFPDELPPERRTIWRKLGEMRVAREIESRYDKRQILELYLNQIYFGSGAWGIQAAALEFFGKPASELTLAEGALLAGLPAAPSVLNPRADPDAAVVRRRVVLSRMVGAGFITIDEATAAAAEPVVLSRGEWPAGEAAPYFVETVRQEMDRELGRALYTRGLTIHTTLDPLAQRSAERELAAQLDRIEAGGFGVFRHARYAAGATAADGTTAYLQGAVVVMDLETGGVLAMVGGRDFESSKFNRAVQARRQPGSAFKPIVYAAALAAGYPPTMRLSDTPYVLRMPDGQVWAPRNYGGGHAGQVTLRDALRMSRNVPTVRLADQVGLDRVIEMARDLGLRSQLPAVPSVVLGAGEVTLLDLVAAYTPFATLGRRVEPRLVSRVEDRDGTVVWTPARRDRQVLDPAVAFLVTDLLRDAVNRGTGTPVRAAGFRAPAAGKTGTTNEETDVWFIGYTPTMAAGVWIGFDRRRTIVRGATGGRLAAPVWARVMTAAGAAAGDWQPPPGVVVQRVDAFGLVVPQDCQPLAPTRTEYFLRGTVAATSCHDYIHAERERLWADMPELLGEEVWWRDLREQLLGDTVGDGAGRATDPTDPGADTARPRGPPPDTGRGLLGEPVPRSRRPDPPADSPAPGRPPAARDTVRQPAPPDTARPPRPGRE